MGTAVAVDVPLRGHGRRKNMVRQDVRLGHQVNQQVIISLFAECLGHGKSRAKRFPNSSQ